MIAATIGQTIWTEHQKGRPMRKPVLSIALALSLMSIATTAEARGRYGEDLRFVAVTSIPGGGPIALCHLVDFMDALFIPVYTTVQSYALSNDGCTGETFRPLTTENFISLQEAGMIPDALPATPKLSIRDMIAGHAWLILGGLGVALKGLTLIAGRRRSKPAQPDTLAIHSLVAMSQVAVADGHIEDRELNQISHILTRLTGQAYAPAQVADLLSRLNPSPSDLAQVGEDLSENDRQIVLEAALNVAVADGEIHPSEYAIVSDLAHRMRIGAEPFRRALARISAHLNTAQPA